jgi:hypothetical protein
MIKGDIDIDKPSELAKLISSIPKRGLDHVTIEQLAKICTDLLKFVTFCRCSHEVSSFLDHKCDAFQLPEPEHCPICKCCQTCAFKLYLAILLEKLANADKLPTFIKYGLTRGRIRNRCYNLESNGHVLKFKIKRHPGAWTNLQETRLIEMKFEFNFENLELKLLSTLDNGLFFAK